jgi:hypothetical protein
MAHHLFTMQSNTENETGIFLRFHFRSNWPAERYFNVEPCVIMQFKGYLKCHHIDMPQIIKRDLSKHRRHFNKSALRKTTSSIK